MYLLVAAGQDVQAAGMSPMDNSRQRTTSGPLMYSGSYAKQKNPIANDPATKDSVVIFIFLQFMVMHIYIVFLYLSLVLRYCFASFSS